MTDSETLRKAKKRASAKFGVYIHAAVFVLVMLLLFTINLIQGGSFWSLYPFLGWGFGLAIHAFVIFKVSGHGLYEKCVQAELDKLQQK